MYRNIIAQSPEMSHGYGGLGGLYFDAGEYAEAAEFLSHAVELNPHDFKHLHNLGLALVGLGYAAYILSVLVVVESLAPGWLTTNAMLALSAVFMGFSTLGLSLGLQHLLKLHRKDNGERASEEVNRIDLFGKVATDLNVELESESQPVLRGDG